MKAHREPIKLKAGSRTILINGYPPSADCRVIAETEYQLLLSAYCALTAIESIIENDDDLQDS